IGGKPIEVWGCGAAIAIRAHMIGADGVDRDQNDVEVRGERSRDSCESDLVDTSIEGRIAADAVVVDAVVGNLRCAWVHRAVPVVAISTAQKTAVAIAVEVADLAKGATERAAEARVSRGSLANRFGVT